MRILRAAAAGIAVAACAAIVTANASAITVGAQLDQTSSSTANTSDGLVSQFHSSWASQTFTAGLSGQLTNVDVKLFNEPFISSAGTVRMAINPVSGGVPNTAVELAVSTVTVASLSQTYTTATADFTFATPAVLVAGTMYAITLTEVSGVHEHVYWAGATSNTYAAGAPSQVGIGTPSGDLAFATYVLPSAVAALGGSRLGYCLHGTFLDLVVGQPDVDGLYSGATPAMYVQGVGITCGPVPTGYVLEENASTTPYPFYAPA
jgi:hypothetical protein